jgi:hypothetical protein
VNKKVEIGEDGKSEGGIEDGSTVILFYWLLFFCACLPIIL